MLYSTFLIDNIKQKTYFEMFDYKTSTYREIMEQYKDFWHRAHRLEPAHRAFLGGKPAPIHLVTNEDMCLYLNWMCWKFSSTEKINNFIMVL